MAEPVTEAGELGAAVTPAGHRAVLVSTRSFSTGSRDLVAELAEAGLTVVRVSTDHELAALEPHLQTAIGWIAGTAPVTAAHLAAAPHLKVLARYGVGVESVDVAAADRAGVLVTNTPGANSFAVSELTVALAFAALRGIAAADARVRTGDWSVRRGRQLSGATVGVVGFGRIGRGTATLLRGLGCPVLVHDPFVSASDIAAVGATPVALQDIRQCELVVLHAPGGERLVDAQWLADGPSDQVLINTARADLVDEQAVAQALRSGRLAAYAADTLAGESDVALRSPLLHADLRDRVTITAHLGAQTVEAVDGMGSMAVANVIAVLTGKPPVNPVPLPSEETA